MNKLWGTIRKEFLLLKRDYEGLLLLFAMPLFLVVVMTLLQDSTFRSINEKRIKVAFLSADNGLVGEAFENGLSNSDFFTLVKHDTATTTPEQLKQAVANGKYTLGVIVPENTTKSVKNSVMQMVKEQLPDFITTNSDLILERTIDIVYDPTTKPSMKQAISSSLESFIAKVENRIIIKAYSNVLSAITNLHVDEKDDVPDVIQIKESFASSSGSSILPNSVQHNIPAWTLFAMFFICIPLAGNIIREKQAGSMVRLSTLPVSPVILLLGKVLIYVMVCLLQALFIFLVGKFLMPYLGLPALQFGHDLFALFLLTLSCGLAATGLGVAIGNLSKTMVQAGSFGSILVMILAAIGGIWVPIYLMPQAMRLLSHVSPLNWGITAYYDLFIRNAGLIDILPEILKLLAFFVVMLFIAAYFRKTTT